ncbi:4Fe-4S binding protein [bacterium]|nr:4Fe-4S binding protein [bacterium]
MKTPATANGISRIIFLLITPVFFQFFAIGFIWHSIYWGVITAVVLIWGFFILISPLFGRIGCGWFCFMGTTMDLAGRYSLRTVAWNKPNRWVRLLILIPFFASALTFYAVNKSQGLTHNFSYSPGFLKPEFTVHYAWVWTIDIASAILFGLLLERRWICRNLCFMGALCSAGAHFARLIPLVDPERCTLCGNCEQACPVRIPITGYVRDNQGLVTNAECIMCGACLAVCKKNAIRFSWVWNRSRLISQRNNHLAIIDSE